MPIRQFEPSRAIEVIAPKYGSGYRLGGGLVLTAAHLLDEVGSDCEVRDKQSFGKEKAHVVWKAQGLDLALIELPEGVAGVDAITLGQLPEATAGEKLVFQMYAYPRWARTQREQGSAAGGRQIEGVIYLSDRSPDGLLVLESERLPPEGTAAGSEWAGASGAAIVCDGLVIAVQSQHQNPNRPASLEATSLGTVYDDGQWRQLLEKHGICLEPEIAHLQTAEKPLKIFWQEASAQPKMHDVRRQFLQIDFSEEEKAISVRHLLGLDIQQDCKLLQQLFDHDDQNYLAEKWQSCLKENRAIWRDIPSRTLLIQYMEGELIQDIQNFYERLDSIQEKCRNLLKLKSMIQPFAIKPKYGDGVLCFKSTPPPAWAEKYITVEDEIALLNAKKVNAMSLMKLKKIIQATLSLGNQILDQLSLK